MAEETTTSSTRSSQSGRSNNGKWKASQGAESSVGVEGAMDTAKTAFSGVSEKASEYIDSATSYMKSFDANPVSFIRQYPVQAAIGGVVIGFILGAAVSRRSLTE